jgi:hypothetical protein
MGISMEGLIFKAWTRCPPGFSTKLSTENLDGAQSPEKSSTYRQFQENY